VVSLPTKRQLVLNGNPMEEIVVDALAWAGSGWHDVVRTRLIPADIEVWKAVVDVRAKYRRDAKPVGTIMQVTQFVNPEWLVEVEADAVVADWPPASG
jgi:enamine deaminase RidA (YjgF/YER057c/UK114 family)